MRKILIIPVLIISASFFTACFSPWEGEEGSFSISIGTPAPESRSAWNWDEFYDVNDFYHTVIITNGPGPEQTVTDIKRGERINFRAASGYWDIIVEAYHPDGNLIARGVEQVNIKPGQNPAIHITMKSDGIEYPFWTHTAGSWREIFEIIQNTQVRGKAIILLTENITMIDRYILERIAPLNIDGDKEITLVSKDNITFSRDTEYGVSFFDIQNGTLILGDRRINGEIIIDGRFPVINTSALSLIDPLINIGSIDESNPTSTNSINRGHLIMNNGITLQYNGSNPIDGGRAVTVICGNFLMNDGSIKENSHNSNGGGVYVSNNGTFIMNGGSINNNYADNGGGVFVEGNYNPDGNFIMNNGYISSNTAAYGGGVYVSNNGGIGFMMKGGVISGNWAWNRGGGVGTQNGLFKKTGGIIYGSATIDTTLRQPVNFINDNMAGLTADQGNTGITAQNSHAIAVLVSSRFTTSDIEYDYGIDQTITGAWPEW